MWNFPVTHDSLWRGRLKLTQPAKGHGYRFNLDPVLLAGFAPAAGHVLDLGAGCGVLGLLLLKMNKAERVTAVEVQPELAALAQQNAVDNGFGESQFRVLGGDLRSVPLPRDVDLCAFNPPYFKAKSGRSAPNPSRDVARFERCGTLADFVDRAAFALGPSGALAAIVPFARGQELRALADQAGLGDQRVQHITPRPGDLDSAQHVLLCARHGAARELHEPPLIVHAADTGRTFSPLVQAWVDGP
jgi:tRNA1Val (adenine37-N6)-methyltransferase